MTETDLKVTKGSKIRVRGIEHTVIGFFKGHRTDKFIKYATAFEITQMAYSATESRIFWRMVAEGVIEIA